MQKYLTAVLLLLGASVVARASDFATEVFEYELGQYNGEDIQPDPILTDFYYDNPLVALGRPTIDTTGDNLNTGLPSVAVPVVPVNPAFRYTEVVSIGQGGHLTLKFDHPVIDDPLNPCGIDLIVFGNSKMVIGGSMPWTNGNPNSTSVLGLSTSEPGTVAVSPDGVTWYTYTSPKADAFPPTLGRRYDTVNYETSLPGNLWWGQPTDPTYPLTPGLTAASLGGQSVAAIAKRYGISAGGAGFDLSPSGFAWIQYVRISNPMNSNATPEIDAVADVTARVLPDFDCDSDCDDADLAFFETCATGPGITPPNAGCERTDLDQDGDVDATDFAIVQRCRTGSGMIIDPACMQ